MGAKIKGEAQFQFHKGTIKTRVNFLINLFFHFNSIKVQLKQNIVMKENQRNEFQFHKGTIKTPLL